MCKCVEVKERKEIKVNRYKERVEMEREGKEKRCEEEI